MKIIKSILFLFFLSNSVHGQNDALDSLQNLLSFTKSDTARISIYVEKTYAAEDTSTVLYSDTAISLINKLLPNANRQTITELHRYSSNAYYFRSMFFANAEAYDTALYYLKSAMEQALLAKDNLQEARILNDMGVCYYRKNELEKSIDLLSRSLTMREGLNDEVQLRNAYNNTAFIYKETGLIDQSLELNFKALALAEKDKDYSSIALSFNNIGQLYHKYLKDRTRALEYYKKGLAISEREGDKKGVSLVKNNIATLYAEQDNYKEAIKWFEESLELRREINYKYGIINTLSNLGYNYLKLSDYGNARNALAEALQMNEVLLNNNLQSTIHQKYAELYLAIGNTDSALYHANLSHNINVGAGNPLSISTSALLLSGLYETAGNYRASIDLLKLHNKMQDSISNDDLQKQGVKSNIEYQYLKKKNETDKIHNEQLARKNLFSWLFIFLFVASIIIGFGLYKRYRLKQQLKEVEIRNKIAADLHDDVGSTLSSIRMYSDIVKQQPNQTGTSIQLLEKISSNSKETIENMSDIVWMIKPGNDDFANIEDRMLNFANELCTPAGINFEMNKNNMLNGLKIPMKQRRDIYLIFKEAINNAVKYSKCHFIRTAIQLDKNILTMHISDDGNGFDMAHVKNGNGLSNMQKRAAANKGSCHVHSKEGEGTEIEIVFNL